MREAASTPKLKRILENMPQAALVELFDHFIRVCMRRKVFGNKSVADVAKTIEQQALGKYRAAPNQSPMPKERRGVVNIIAKAAEEENKS